MIAIFASIAAAIWFLRAHDSPASANRAIAAGTKSTDANPKGEPAPIPQPASTSNRVASDSSEPVRSESNSAGSRTVLVLRAISSEDRAPLARVRFSVELPTIVLESNSKDGRAEFDAVPGESVHVVATADDEPKGYAELTIEALKGGERREVTVELPTQLDRQFVLQVVAAESGAPISRAKVTVLAKERRRGDSACNGKRENAVAELSTDANGWCETLQPSWYDRALEISAVGRSTWFAVVNASHGSRQSPLRIELQPSASLSVRVHANSPSALDQVRVRVSTSANSLTKFETASEYAPDWFVNPWCVDGDANGPCKFAELPSSVPLKLELLRDGESLREIAEPIVLAPGEDRAIDIELEGSSVIRGRLIDDHEAPISERTMWLVAEGSTSSQDFDSSTEPSQSTSTDANGRFEFSHVAIGGWLVGLAARHNFAEVELDDLVSRAVLTEVHANGEELTLDIHASASLYLRGLVVDPNGTPVANARVSGQPELEGERIYSTSHGDGRFVVGPLLPGTVDLWAESPDWSRSPSVSSGAGATDLTLHLRPPIRLHVRCVDSNGAPVERATVIARAKWGEARPRDWTSGRLANGECDLGPLSSGEVDMCAFDDRDRFAFKRVRFDGLAGELTLTVRAGAKVELVHPGSGACLRVTAYVGDVWLFEQEVSRGARVTLPLPAVPVRLDVQEFGSHSQARSNSIELTLAPDESRTVNLPDGH